MTPAERMIAMIRKTGKTPEYAFIAALQNYKIFDADPTMTAITYYKSSATVDNFTRFRIQIKFVTPVDYFKISNGGSTAQ